MTFLQSKQHGLLGRLAPVITFFAVGCTLIVPVDDYVGGGSHGGGTSSGGGSGGGGGSDNAGGSGGGSVGGSVEVGGTGDGASGENAGGGAGETGGSDAGAESGGAPEGAGMAGESHGGDGAGTTAGGTAGAGTGETGGTGGVAASAGLGGRGGTGGAGGGSCAKVDFQTDPDHCGGCEIACEIGEKCLDGVCRASPCDGVCATFKTIKLAPGQGYKTTTNLGTTESCTEVIGYDPSPEPPSFVCWNVVSPRTVELNGVRQVCDVGGRELDIPLRVGGYCVHLTAGQKPEAGFEFP